MVLQNVPRAYKSSFMYMTCRRKLFFILRFGVWDPVSLIHISMGLTERSSIEDRLYTAKKVNVMSPIDATIFNIALLTVFGTEQRQKVKPRWNGWMLSGNWCLFTHKQATRKKQVIFTCGEHAHPPSKKKTFRGAGSKIERNTKKRQKHVFYFYIVMVFIKTAVGLSLGSDWCSIIQITTTSVMSVLVYMQSPASSAQRCLLDKAWWRSLCDLNIALLSLFRAIDNEPGALLSDFCLHVLFRTCQQ